ncbi:hypothetical protein FSP39_025340 [Pinctada imbricata]|uniref:Major facilitator superfamily (MFS) profile domain-containing protein n=1 Tax=Pinctada imbricata TaxID=66713 RepID=A0AA89C063_PINIB|nr:hypothetical protein FSP39_025340 [Pinctada imbricata]
MTYYVINEYANEAIRNLFFPNVTLNSSRNVGCHEENLTSKTVNISNVVQAKLAEWSIYYSIASGMPSLIASSLLSSLSDKYGRKNILFFSLLGACIKMIACTCAIHYQLNIYYFVLVGFLEGCTGSWITVLSISFAYVADITSTGNERSIVIAIYELILNLGFYSGTLSSGFLINRFGGYFVPSAVATIGGILATIISNILPETFHREESPKICEKTKQLLQRNSKMTNIFDHIKLLLRMFRKTDEDEELQLKYILSMAAIILIWMSHMGGDNVELYYSLSYPICFNAEEIGIFRTTRGVVQQFITVIFLRMCQLCKIRDEVTAAVSCIFGTAQYIVLGMAESKSILYVAAGLYTFMFAGAPVLRSTMSKLTHTDKQGSIFGAIAFFENICSMSGSVIAGAIYSVTVPIYKGFVFFVLASYSVIAAVLLL